MRLFTTLALAFVVAACLVSIGTAVTPTTRGKQADALYPYGSARFTAFVNDSFREGGRGNAKLFYDWMSSAYSTGKFRYPGKPKLTLEQVLDAKHSEITGIKDTKLRARAQINLGSWLHRMVKTTIPRFSLERGFEFRHTVAYGERQCFLQSVLIAGMLQRAGVDAGVVMVYKNIKGEESNNGHAVTLAKLADGRDIIVDASEPMAFPRHRGLFVDTGNYSYVEPVYGRGSDAITSYIASGSRSRISTKRVRPLDAAFLDSQFWYYRGERAVGGILAAHPTKAGLESSAKALRKSVKLCPRNALAVYMLGRVYRAQGNTAQARKQFERAESLYSKFGWVPAGAKEAASQG